MKNLGYLNLNENKVADVVNGLGDLLADLQVYYTNLRAFHWNIKGKGFFILHSKFEEMYDDVTAKVDEVAERILQLDGTPENKFSKYLEQSEVKEVGALQDSNEAIENILETLRMLIMKERRLVQLAVEANDDVTVALMGDYLKGQEKQVWMLNAFRDK